MRGQAADCASMREKDASAGTDDSNAHVYHADGLTCGGYVAARVHVFWAMLVCAAGAPYAAR